MKNNIIDFAKYYQLVPPQAEPKYLPIIYALENASGEPLILFRFVKGEESVGRKDNIIQLKNKE